MSIAMQYHYYNIIKSTKEYDLIFQEERTDKKKK